MGSEPNGRLSINLNATELARVVFNRLTPSRNQLLHARLTLASYTFFFLFGTNMMKSVLTYSVGVAVSAALTFITGCGAKTDEATVAQLKSFRAYFVVGAAAVAGIATPPDPVSMLALLVPMCVLYEVGILAAKVFIKHSQAPDDDAAATAS